MDYWVFYVGNHRNEYYIQNWVDNRKRKGLPLMSDNVACVAPQVMSAVGWLSWADRSSVSIS